MGHGHMGRIILFFLFYFIDFNFGRKITGELIDYGGGSQFCFFLFWLILLDFEHEN